MRNVSTQRRLEVSHPFEALPGVMPDETLDAAPSSTLAVRIRRSILRLATGRIRDLRVEVRDDTIVLQGACGSYYCKQLAQHAAMETATGQRVYNQIEVQ